MKFREAPRFRVTPLDNMVAVGKVSSTSARIWIRSASSGSIRISYHPDEGGNEFTEIVANLPYENGSDNTLVVDLSQYKGESLKPLTLYRYRVVHDELGFTIGEGSFETTPGAASETPPHFSIAILSCNQPFKNDGTIHHAAPHMLSVVKQCLDHHNTRLVFMVGDQIYSDVPPRLSLFDSRYFSKVSPPGRHHVLECTTEEVRSLYQMRHRTFWSLPEFQAIQAHYPCYMILDDHDIVDNWGSDPRHQLNAWSRVGEGARWACFDYQSSRVLPDTGVLPDDFHFSGAYGHTAFFTFDLRSTRVAGEQGQLFSKQQQEGFDDFLSKNSDKKLLVVVLSVPVLHLPRMMAHVAGYIFPQGEDFSDRWSGPTHKRDRDWFLRRIYEHQKNHLDQRLVLISGDIHIGCVHRILWGQEGPECFQFIASAVTHETSVLMQTTSKWLIRINRHLKTMDGKLSGRVHLLKGPGGKSHNPYGGLNVGIIDIETPTLEASPALRFSIYGHRGEDPVCVFRSEWYR